MTTPIASSSAGARRKRAPLACSKCHRRKVKCDLSTKGFPCSKCRKDRVDCNLFQPKRTRAGTSTTGSPVGDLQSADSEGIDCSSSQKGPRQTPLQPVGALLPSLDQPLEPPSGSHPRSTHQSPPEAPLGHSIFCTGQTEIEDHEKDRIKNAEAFNECLDDQKSQDVMPFYVGDEQGLEFLLDICRPGRQGRNHFLVPHAVRDTVRPEDMLYLRANHVFDLPSKDLLFELIWHYIRYIHPTCPVVDIKAFLLESAVEGPPTSSLILLWSMFSVSAAFVPLEVVQAAGFRSNKEMQHSCYQKAKCLYDVDFERDKVTLIQSIILMSHRYADTEDRSGPWHWIGVAISLSHTIGLHRDPLRDNSTANENSYFEARISLWRRIWWSCVYREIWLGFSHGRPMRIHLDDCDMPMPSRHDMWAGTSELSMDVRQKFMPESEHCSALSQIYLANLQLSIVLAKLVRAHYGPNKSTATAAQIKSDEDMILQHSGLLQGYREFPHLLVQNRASHVLINYEVLMIVLYRPYLLSLPNSDATVDLTDWKTSAQKKAKLAADNISTILNRLISLESVKICDTTIILALKPAMQIYVLLSTSPNSLHRRHAFIQLEIFMLALREMLPSAWTAGMTIDLFRNAMKKLAGGRESSQPRFHPGVVEQPAEGTVLGSDPAERYPRLSASQDHCLSTDAGLPGNEAFDDMTEWLMPNVGESWELALESVFTAEGLA